ncbi:MAG TPA: hypothetical protein VF598_02630, partial [Hymenobacter sp.]
NDPVKGITALTRVGVTFTEQQKEQITQMVKAGNTAGAQKLIIAELNKEFGGSAEAARKAAGGMATLSMRWGEMKETVGEFVSQGLNKLSEFLGVLLDKSQPLVDVFVEFGQEIAVYYGKIMDLVEGLGLFGDKSEMATTLINFLTEAVKLMLMPMRVSIQIVGELIDGFVNLYNKSEMVRGVLGGLVNMVMTGFKTIKDNAIKYLSGVGDLIVGVFTLDTDRIKEGLGKTLDATADVVFKSGVRNAQAFVAGYNSNKDDFIVRKPKAEGGSDTKGAGDEVVTSRKEEAPGSSQKDLEKAAKAREAAAKKAKAAQDKLDQARLDAIKAQVAHEEKLEDLRIASIADKREREVAKINLDAHRKGQVVTGTEQEITAQLEQINEERQRKLQELADKYLAEGQAKSKEQLDQQLAGEEAAEAVREAQLQDQFEQAMISEQTRDQLVYEAKRASLQAKLELEEQYAGKSSAGTSKTTRELEKLDKDHNKQLTENTKKREEAKSQFIHMGLQTASSALQLTIDILGRDEAARKKNAGLIKAFTTAKILIDGVEEVSAIWKNANSSPLNILLPGAGTAMAIAQTAMAAVRTGFALSQVKGQQFAQGGATGGGMMLSPGLGSMAVNSMGNLMEMSGMAVGSNGKMIDSTGFAVAGIVHEDEYVIPKWMRQDPKVMAVENWLEARRLRGYAEGGATSDGGRQATAADLPLPGAPDAAVQERMLSVLERLDSRLGSVETWQRDLKVCLSLRELDDTQSLKKQVAFDN